MAGLVQMVPVQATVIRLDFSIVPQLTNTAGSGYIVVPGFQFCLMLSGSAELHVGASHLLAAVVAAERERLAVGHSETGAHRLVVGDALRIAAFHYAYDLVGEFHMALLHHLEVAYDVDYRARSDDGYAVERLFGEKHVGYLDDTLGAHQARVEIIADSHMCAYILNAEQLHYLEKGCAWYMVDHRAVAERGYCQFFLLSVHRSFTFDGDHACSMPSARQMIACRA